MQEDILSSQKQFGIMRIYFIQITSELFPLISFLCR